MKLHFQIFALIGFLGIQSMFAQTWVNFTKTSPADPVLTLILNTNQQVKFTAEIPGMFTRTVSEQGTLYQRLAVPDYPVMKTEGSPELPSIRQLLAIPECSQVQISYNVSSWKTFSNYRVYPVPDLVEVQYPGGTVGMKEYIITGLL